MVKIELSFLKSKLAKRIFSLFLIASLLPIAILAYFTFQQIDTLIAEKSMYQLRQESKQFGHALYDRLLLSDENLRFLVAVYSARDKEPFVNTESLNQHFNSIISIKADGEVNSLHGLVNYAPVYSETQKQQLLAGKSVLIVQKLKAGLTNLWLLQPDTQRQGTDQTTIFAGLLKADFIWGLAENLDQRIGLCIHNATTRLFCSTPSTANIIDHYQTQNAPAVTVFADSSDQQQHYFVKLKFL